MERTIIWFRPLSVVSISASPRTTTRPKPVANTDVAAVAVMPIRFQSTENVDSVVTQVQFTSDLDVAWENTVAVPNFIFDKASNVGVTDCGVAINTATMTATKNDAVRTVNLRILKASSDTVFYTDTVCQRITPNTYNRYGWHDPEGRFFVLKEELERWGGLESYIRMVEEEKIRVEPLVIRANAGDCIELRTTNLLPEYLEANAFQLRTRTDIVGHHVHLVKFDTITSAGCSRRS